MDGFNRVLCHIFFINLHSKDLRFLNKTRLITSAFVQLLLEHLEAISPDRNDLLHELLQDLGDVPDVETLLGTVEQTFIYINLKLIIGWL